MISFPSLVSTIGLEIEGISASFLNGESLDTSMSITALFIVAVGLFSGESTWSAFNGFAERAILYSLEIELNCKVL